MNHATIFPLLVIASCLALILAVLSLETLSSYLLAMGIGYSAGPSLFHCFLRRSFWQAKGKAVQQGVNHVRNG